MRDLTGLATRIFNAPLAIWPAKGDAIMHVLSGHLGVASVPVVPMALLDVQKADRDSLAMTADGIAVIDICGTLVRKSSGLNALSGLTSYSDIEADVQQAMMDPRCTAILLNCDSPGGEVGGLFDLCSKLRAWAKQKPMYAAVSEMACSAMYAVAACCTKIFITQTAAVGSIGVYAMHVDRSEMDKKEGLKYTYIQAGDRKTEGNPHEPLSSDARSRTQAEIDRTCGIFVAHVAECRGMTTRAVRATEAGVYFAEEALGLNLADAIGTTEDALSALRAALPPVPQAAALFRAEKETSELKAIENSANLATAKAALGNSTATGKPEEPQSSIEIEIDEEEDDLEEDLKESKAAAAEAEIPMKESAAMSQTDPALVAAPIAAAMDTQRINALCKIANRKDLLSSFIDRGLSASEVEEELMKMASDESAASRIDSRVNPSSGSKASGVAGIRQMLVESRTAAEQNNNLTPQQAFTKMLERNPSVYADYKRQKMAASFRYNSGDQSAVDEVLALVTA